MFDRTIFVAVVFLITASLVMSYSLSTYTVVHFGYDQTHFFIRQIIAACMGFVLMILLSKLDPDKWFVPIGLFLFFSFLIIMSVMYFMPSSIVRSVGGAKRWIQVGPLSIAPVEFFKIGFVFFLAWSFSRKLLPRDKMSFTQEFLAFLPYILVFLFAVFLIAVLQKDLGQITVLGATLLIMFVFAGSSFKFFFSLVGAGIIAFIGLIAMAPHRIDRIKGWWVGVQDTMLLIFPFEFVQNLRIDTAVKEPYQISNSLNAIHNGGLFGEGLGNGQFKLGYLSEVHTDFVLAGIAEEYGFVGVFLISLAILVIIFRLFKIASSVQNPVYYLFSVGVALLIGFAFVINSFGIAGITPIKGIAVPFVSYGGSQILALCFAMGMIFMISNKPIKETK